MPKILIVHGIANQFVGESELRDAWFSALCDGLERAESAIQFSKEDCFCPFYGDLFREPGTLGAGTGEEIDPEEFTEADLALLESVWRSAAATDANVPSPEDFGETLFRAPHFAERALNALAGSRYLADYLPLRFLGDLKQVALYLDDREMRRQILDRVLRRLDSSTRLVIGHSLGSVVAYEALCIKPETVDTFITIGSPLGLREIVFSKLTPRPLASGLGHWPGKIRHWTNIAANGDIVAAQKELAPFFGNEVEDFMVDSGGDAHNSTRYLNTLQAGRTVARALA